MGIDPSLSATGLALPGETRVIRPKCKGAERLLTIRREIAGAVLQYEIDLAVIEKIQFVQYVEASLGLAQAAGVIQLTLYELGVPCIEMPTTSLKLFATGHGNANKAAMLSAARASFPLETFEDDNQADARWLLELGRVIVGKVKASEHQRRALAGVVVPNGLRRLVGAR